MMTDHAAVEAVRALGMLPAVNPTGLPAEAAGAGGK
jgi:hypothetical protein